MTARFVVLVIIGIGALFMTAMLARPCTADSPRGPTIGGVIKIYGC